MLHIPTRWFAGRANPVAAPPVVRKRPMVLLADELAKVRDDLSVAQARFDDRLIIDIFCGPDAAGVPVPPGLLRPLVARAVDLGVARSDERLVLSLFARMTGRVLRLVLRSEAAFDLADDDGEDTIEAVTALLRDAFGSRALLTVERVGHYSAVALTIDDGLRPH